MSEEVTTEEVVKEEFILTDELRAEALKKPTFKILYIGDGDSRLSLFRGESMIRTFSSFYERQANIEYFTATSSMLGKITLDDLKNFNILWIDNISDFKAAKNLADIQDQLLETIEPNWKKKLSEFEAGDKKAIEFGENLNKERSKKLRIVYALDEFIWEGKVGRAYDIQTVQLMETFLSICDSVVVPTPELKEAMLYYKFVKRSKEIYVIPSSVSVDFFPLFKNFTRRGKAELTQLRDKPKILIKGLSVPKNIENFILENYKKLDITLCSVDEVNDHIMSLVSRKKVNHIYHWANPYVNKGNLVSTYAIERDAGYDFVIHTKPDDLRGDMYEITTGDEDVLFSISYGALPITGLDHLGYDADMGNKHLGLSGETFGKDTSSKKLTKLIDKLGTPILFNEAFNKCRQEVEHRLSTSPFIISRYFNVMLGKDLAKARTMISKEKQKQQKQQEENEKKSESETKIKEKPENVVEGNFNKV